MLRKIRIPLLSHQVLNSYKVYCLRYSSKPVKPLKDGPSFAYFLNSSIPTAANNQTEDVVPYISSQNFEVENKNGEFLRTGMCQEKMNLRS